MIHLKIITPYKTYFEGEVSFIGTSSSKGTLGILPNHYPLISDLLISVLTLHIDDKVEEFAIGGGLLNIEKNSNVTLMVKSIEHFDEIDLDRAYRSKDRAMKRLENLKIKKDISIDVKRAELSLKRALNRINLRNK